MRHLIFTANAETTEKKKLIFCIVRCLHCHVGAPHNLHRKATLPSPVYVYKFQREWLEMVVQKCPVKSLDKAVRIICDYYMSRTEQVRNEEGEAAALAQERGLFVNKRDYDTRVQVAEERLRGEKKEEVVQILGDDIQNDPAACTPLETANAIKDCQVCRASARCHARISIF